MSKNNINNLLNYFTNEELNQIIEIDDLYLRAKKVVITIFKDKFDKAGKPYIEHLLRVSDKLNEPIEKIAGLLHDVVEDTDVTFDDLLEIGFSKDIIDIVKLVTKNKIDKINMSEEEKLKLYNDEIDGIINSGNMHAIRLKEADMSDNFDVERLKDLPYDKQEWFNKKYRLQLIKLRKAKEKK